MMTVSSSGSPCLSPIRYAIDTSQINQSQSNEKFMHNEENILPISTEDIQTKLPMDDSSLKVSEIFLLKIN
jgi:hypothetical protein